MLAVVPKVKCLKQVLYQLQLSFTGKRKNKALSEMGFMLDQNVTPKFY
jgi:hypothetical protein